MLFNINRFHFCALLTWQFIEFFSIQMIFSIFSNHVPQWRCGPNGTFSARCDIYLSCNETIEFEEVIFQSAALDYGWICSGSAYLASLYSQIQFFGVLIGTVLFGSVSDAFGRRPVAIFVLFFGFSTLVCSGLVSSWQILLLLRFFVGLFIGGSIVSVWTCITEMLLPEQRIPLRGFFHWGWARLLLTVICYFFPNWRTATFVNAICVFPALLSVVFICPESPTWLHSKGRREEMRNSERKIARVAGIPYVEVEHPKLQRNHSFMQVIRNLENAKRLLVLWLMWFTASLCGYINDLHSSRISGNLYINQIVFSILIIISKIVLVTVDTLNPSFGRRMLHQYSQAAVCTCFLVLVILVMAQYNGVAILVINVIGTVFIEYTWDACYLCTVESMPTSMRASSLGSCSLIGRTGALLSPTVNFLSTIWTPSAYLTVVLIGVINLTSSCMFLVETKNVNLERAGAQDKSIVEKGTAMNGQSNETDQDCYTAGHSTAF